jgi:riboflavin synthase
MFTGIITDLGRVRALEPRGDTRLTIETGYDTETIVPGASIACSGACLTVVDKGPGWFAADVSAETLSKTTLGDWTPGTAVNLERALRLGEELGGHLVSGHIDGVAEIVERTEDGDSLRLDVAAPDPLMPFIAVKGSVTLDGVSLTVNRVLDAPGGGRFEVNIIPHTAAETTLGAGRPGTRVNLEIDLLARYVQRLQSRENP